MAKERFVKNPKGYTVGDPRKECMRILKEHGTLVRSSKHLVYSVFGQSVTISSTASDYRADRNRLSHLQKLVRENIHAR